MSRYLKSITALVTGVIGWAAFVVASAPAEITAPEWIMLAVAVGTALGVYGVPNAPAKIDPPPTVYVGTGTTTVGGGTVTLKKPPAKKAAAKKAKP